MHIITLSYTYLLFLLFLQIILPYNAEMEAQFNKGEYCMLWYEEV